MYVEPSLVPRSPLACWFQYNTQKWKTQRKTIIGCCSASVYYTKRRTKNGGDLGMSRFRRWEERAKDYRVLCVSLLPVSFAN